MEEWLVWAPGGYYYRSIIRCIAIDVPHSMLSFKTHHFQYVSRDLLQVYKDKLMPVSDLLTPNQFEAE